MKETIEFIPTRHSLLSRLKNWNDDESWRVFLNTYGNLIHNTAIRSGLTEAEAQDVLQETVISVAKEIPKFKYDPGKGSFKAWLMRLTRWRITSQLRKRLPVAAPPRIETPTSTDTATIDRVADPAGLSLEASWDREWEMNLIEAALQRVKRKVDPKQFQIFDLYVRHEWPVTRVARALKVNRCSVYLAKHRIGNFIKREIERLRAQPIS